MCSSLCDADSLSVDCVMYFLFSEMMMIAMASQAKRTCCVLVLNPFVEKIDSESLRELTDLGKLDKRLCADRRICVPWRKRLHRPTPQCHCMKCWKLSLSLCAG